MAGIFTRRALQEILSGESTPEEKADAIYSLYGRAIDDGYVTKAAANASKADAVEQAKADALKNVPKPDAKESEEYKGLLAEFNAYKTKQDARNSKEYADVKPKFFEAVYDKIDRTENAKPLEDQLKALRADFEEYFNPEEPADDKPKPGKPVFGSDTGGDLPKGNKGDSLYDAWGYSKKYGTNNK